MALYSYNENLDTTVDILFRSGNEEDNAELDNILEKYREMKKDIADDRVNGEIMLKAIDKVAVYG